MESPNSFQDHCVTEIEQNRIANCLIATYKQGTKEK